MLSIKICSWNANGLRPKLAELREFLSRLKVDIMLLNETKLTPEIAFKIKNYHIIRKDRTAHGGGVAIIISDKIAYTTVPINNRVSLECIGIKLAGNIHIVSAYNEPRNKFQQQDLNILTSIGNRVLIIGDLNARHYTWNNHTTNTNGRTLFNFIQNTSNIIQHPDEPTHYPENGMAPTCIDIVINKNVPNATNPVSIVELSSDHNPITLELQNHPQEFSHKHIISYKNTDWTAFRHTLNQQVVINTKIDTANDIDKEVELFTTQLQAAQSAHSQKVKVGHNKTQLDDETKRLIQIRNRLRKLYQRTLWQHIKPDINKLNRVIRNKIRLCVNKKWETTLENIKPGDRTLWRITKCFKTAKETIPTLTKNNNHYFTDNEKANLIGETLETIQRNNEKSCLEQEVTSTIEEFFKYDAHEESERTNPSELRTLIRKLPNNKAAGHDNIDNKIIKNLTTKAIVQLMYIINAILKIGYFPKIWKLAVVIPIPKPNKDLANPINYRPISLLTSLSKVAEKVILDRINRFNSDHKIIIDEQFGFRSGHNTAMQVARIAHAIILNYNKSNVTSLVLLDIEKAFDTVWIEGIVYKLIKYHFPQSIIKLLHSYLSGRQFKIRINQSYSKIRNSKAGVPQGSVLGPVIFSYFINDIPKFRQTNLAVYADDTAIYAHSFNAQVATKQTQIHTSMISAYAKKWKIKINNSKTEHLVFARKFTNTKVFEPLRVEGMRVEPAVNAVKYLGVSLDKRMSFVNNTKSLVNKGHKAIRVLYPLLNRNSKLSVQCKKLIYTAIIRPTLTYAAPVWCSMAKTSLLKIQRIQNKCLRLVLNKDRYTTINELHERSGLETIDRYVTRMATKFYQKHIKNSELTKSMILKENELNSLPMRKHKLLYSKINI